MATDPTGVKRCFKLELRGVRRTQLPESSPGRSALIVPREGTLGGVESHTFPPENRGCGGKRELSSRLAHAHREEEQREEVSLCPRHLLKKKIPGRI